MATYAIGDVQGCREPLLRLLDHISFDPAQDRLWFTGDLVNRGPDSLGVLRFVAALGNRAVVVLGNHDLHLLALRHDPTRRAKKGDTVDDILTASDRDALLDWLRGQPLLHQDTALGYTLVHAGLPPAWTVDEAAAHAREVEHVLRGSGLNAFLADMYGNAPDAWTPTLRNHARLRFITNCLTRIRYCKSDGRLDLKAKMALAARPGGLLPWFMLPGRRSVEARIVFGHWSTLRLSAAEERQYRVYPLDTGAVWGGMLSALRLEDQRRYQVRGLQLVEFNAAND